MFKLLFHLRECNLEMLFSRLKEIFESFCKSYDKGNDVRKTRESLGGKTLSKSINNRGGG